MTPVSDVTPRRADIQGLRAVAVLLVVMFHAGLPFPGGFLGVDVFFAISGFVITSMLLRELESSGRIDLWRFYARRVRRLGPALAVMVVTVAILGPLVGPVTTQDSTALTGMFAALFSANLYLATVPTGYFDPATTLNPLLHLWTLGVEEQFYVLFPAVLVLSWWLARRARRGGRAVATFAVGGVLCVSFLLALHWAGAGGDSDPRWAFYAPTTRAWEFAAGALIALVGGQLPRILRFAAPTLTVVSLATLATISIGFGAATGFPVWTTAGVVVATCVLLVSGSSPSNRASVILTNRPAVWLGDLSYSWYLWHWPVIVCAGVLFPANSPGVLAGLISLLPAWLSYRYVELRYRRDQTIVGRRALALLAVCVLAPLVASAGFRSLNPLLDRAPSLQAYERSQRPHLDEAEACAGIALTAQPKGCLWGDKSSPRQIVLLGDSNGGHFSEAVVNAAAQDRIRVRIATRNGCPFVAAKVVGNGHTVQAQECQEFNEANLRALATMKPSLVLIGGFSEGYIGSNSFSVSRGHGTATRSPARKARLWTAGLTSTLRKLKRLGVPTVVIHPAPTRPYAVSDCAVVRILTRSCAPSVSRAAADTRLRLAVEAEDLAIRQVPGTKALDPTTALCDAHRCEGNDGNSLLYRDTYHLSVDGSRRLTELIRTALAASG